MRTQHQPIKQTKFAGQPDFSFDKWDVESSQVAVSELRSSIAIFRSAESSWEAKKVVNTDAPNQTSAASHLSLKASPSL